jgi:hypothetical protein
LLRLLLNLAVLIVCTHNAISLSFLLLYDAVSSSRVINLTSILLYNAIFC